VLTLVVQMILRTPLASARTKWSALRRKCRETLVAGAIHETGSGPDLPPRQVYPADRLMAGASVFHPLGDTRWVHAA